MQIQPVVCIKVSERHAIDPIKIVLEAIGVWPKSLKREFLALAKVFLEDLLPLLANVVLDTCARFDKVALDATPRFRQSSLEAMSPLRPKLF